MGMIHHHRAEDEPARSREHDALSAHGVHASDHAASSALSIALRNAAVLRSSASRISSRAFGLGGGASARAASASNESLSNMPVPHVKMTARNAASRPSGIEGSWGRQLGF